MRLASYLTVRLTASLTAKRMDMAGWMRSNWTRAVPFFNGKPRCGSLRTGHAETENHSVGSSILPLGIDGVSDFGDGDLMLRLNELLLQPIERRAGRL